MSLCQCLRLSMRWKDESKDEEENFAQKIFINDSQYSHELWRCNSIALLEKSLWMIVYIFMNSEDATESCSRNLYQ